LFEAWKSEIGIGAERRCRTSDLIDTAAHRPNLREALLRIARKRFSTDAQIDPTALGKWLGKYEGNIASGCKLQVDRSDATRPRWYLEIGNR
jgi:hypothetical protein